MHCSRKIIRMAIIRRTQIDFQTTKTQRTSTTTISENMHRVRTMEIPGEWKCQILAVGFKKSISETQSPTATWSEMYFETVFVHFSRAADLNRLPRNARVLQSVPVAKTKCTICTIHSKNHCHRCDHKNFHRFTAAIHTIWCNTAVQRFIGPSMPRANQYRWVWIAHAEIMKS